MLAAVSRSPLGRFLVEEDASISEIAATPSCKLATLRTSPLLALLLRLRGRRPRCGGLGRQLLLTLRGLPCDTLGTIRARLEVSQLKVHARGVPGQASVSLQNTIPVIVFQNTTPFIHIVIREDLCRIR